MTKTTAFLLTIALSVINASFRISAQIVHPPITATLLGQTGEDVVGTRSQGKDGVLDVHVRLTGVSGTISKIRITGLEGVWEMPLNTQNWLVSAVPTSDPSIFDVFFEYYKPFSTYTLTVTYSDGQAQTVSTVTPTTTHPPITATLLGQTGEDVVGTRSQGRDGVLDVHVRLTGVSGTISKIRITGLEGVWEMPLNTQNWLVSAVPTSDPSIFDVFFDYYKPISTYTLTVTYSDGQAQTVSTVTPTTTHPPITAILLGRTGEDVVGTRSQGKDGVLDVHVQLTGVSGTISKIRILGAEGIWEMPLNAQNNWLVTAVPTVDPSIFDVFFNFFKPISTYTLIVTYTDGQSQSVNTIIAPPVVPVAFDFALSNSGDKQLNAGSSATNTVSANLVSGTPQQLSLSLTGSAGTLASLSTASCTPNCSTSVSISSTSAALVGVYPITVTAVGGGVSKTTSFTLSVTPPPPPPSLTYYVSSGVGAGAQAAGNDSNPGTLAQPFKTLQKALPLLQPGYTLILRGGEYDTLNGLVNGRGDSIIPSGLSWDQPVTIKAFPGETTVFRRYLPPGYDESVERTKIFMPTQAQCNEMGWTQNYPWGCWSGGSWNGSDGTIRIEGAFVNGYVLMLTNSLSNPLQYVVFDGIVFEAAGITLVAITLGDGAIHLKFQNFEIKNSIQSCLTQPATDQNASKDLWFVNGKVHHCGAPYWVAGTAGAHGTFDRTHPAYRFHQSFYMQSGGVVWDGVEVSDVSGAGVSPLGLNNIIRNSYFHDNTAMAIICAGNWLFQNNVVVTSGSVEGAKTYGCRYSNNTFVGINAANYGISIDQNAHGPDLIENNIIVGYDYGVISNQTGGQSPIVRNNLIVSNNHGREIYESSSSVIPITRQNNLLGQDPKFVNPAAGDFHLQPSSPAIGKATDGGDLGAR